MDPNDNNNEGTPQSSSNKRPRIEGPTQQSTPDVIVITDTPSTATEVKIKRDPAAASVSQSNDVDNEDSEIEIISPSRFKKQAADNNNCILEGNEDDDIQITSSTLTAPNVVYPHLRSVCGIHKFTPLSIVDNSGNKNFCPKCYCLVCDVPASECKEWETNTNNPTLGPHCHAHNGDEKWSNLVKAKRDAAAAATSTTATRPRPPRNPYQRSRQQTAATTNNNSHSSSNHQQIEQLIHNEFLSRLANNDNGNNNNNSNGAQKEARTRTRREMRIPEVLAENFQKALKIHKDDAATVDLTSPPSGASTSSAKITRYKMEGDIPTLSLTNFFVMGIKIGWPYPTVMAPQRQMAFHLIKALNSSKHVVLESPTGTGKSAAILCSVLAWQRHHWKKNGEKNEKVKIIYCSRTHSQVAQMVTSLKQTPYRPRMAILGSRERLCIHKSIKPRGGGSTEEVKGVNVNNECRMRVRNTEKSRKHQLTNPLSSGPYDDDDPPDGPGDGDVGQSQQQQQGEEGGGESEGNSFLSRSKTCPHYRQLTTSRVANLVHSTFVPGKGVDCCSIGGKESKYGAHDIEDLVQFGIDPNIQRDIALFRKDPSESLGLSLKKGAGNRRGCFINKVKEDTPAAMNGSLKVDDRIIRVNGNDVFNSDPANVSTIIKGVKKDPVVLDVTRGGSGSLSTRGDGTYSAHAACPYYVSQMLSKDAEIVFAPYNYVLDPGIREAMGIELQNSVVVLDEAHNVETVLRDAGSGRFGEIELCDLIVMLNNYAMIEKSTGNMLELEGSAEGESEMAYLCDIAHTLLLFVEKIVKKLRDDKKYFETNPGKKGAVQVLRECEKYNKSDDSEFEVTFEGPTGRGQMGKAVGCRPFFDKLGLTELDFLTLSAYGNALEKFLRGRDDGDGSSERDRVSNLLDRLMELIVTMSSAMNESCHYYAAVMVTANGSLEYAANGEVESEGTSRWPKRKPKTVPLIPPRTEAYPNRPPNPCMNQYCRAQCSDVFNPIRHGDCCDGSKPRWEAFLCLELLTPGPLMQQLANECRTVVLASGSLAPIPSLCAELNLFPEDSGLVSKPSPSPMHPSNISSKIQKRLQNKPAPLEAGHVIDLDKQLRCISIGHFPDGSELKVSHSNYKHEEFLEKLGYSLARIVEGVPEGGVLIFFPSYALLKKCEKLWNPRSYSNRGSSFWMSQRERDYLDGNSVWNRLKAAKHNVVVESSGSQDEFEERKEEYMNSVKTMGGCVLLAVYRGKMSEGISFNDNNARAVICVGLPLPNSFVLPIKVKMDYNDEQRRIQKRTDLLPGREWYNQQAYRAIAQALGRCIRHIGDYGAIFLLDIRHCDDGSPNNGCPTAHINLPKWMRTSVRNLSRNSSGRSPSIFQYASNSEIPGGWNGLKPELHKFFKAAKPFAANVLNKNKEKKNSSPCPPLPPQITATQPSGPSAATTGANKQSSSIGGANVPQSAAKVNSNLTRPPIANKQSSLTNKASSTSSNTLQAMFQKQREPAPTEEGKKKPPVITKSKKANTPKNLITMFEKQRKASLSQDAPIEESKVEDESENTTTANNKSAPAATTTKVFQASPFEEETNTPSEEAAPVDVSQQQVAAAAAPPQQGSQLSAIDEEHLCVICEDARKQVMILPCRHMCLCTKCADSHQIKECPLCRGKVESSMTVYW